MNDFDHVLIHIMCAICDKCNSLAVTFNHLYLQPKVCLLTELLNVRVHFTSC